MIWFKSCPKCHGELYDDRDRYGLFVTCAQCGYHRDVNATALKLAKLTGYWSFPDRAQVTLNDLEEEEEARPVVAGPVLVGRSGQPQSASFAEGERGRVAVPVGSLVELHVTTERLPAA